MERTATDARQHRSGAARLSVDGGIFQQRLLQLQNFVAHCQSRVGLERLVGESFARQVVSDEVGHQVTRLAVAVKHTEHEGPRGLVLLHKNTVLVSLARVVRCVPLLAGAPEAPNNVVRLALVLFDLGCSTILANAADAFNELVVRYNRQASTRRS